MHLGGIHRWVPLLNRGKCIIICRLHSNALETPLLVRIEENYSRHTTKGKS